MSSGIYKIINIINKKFYIGSSKNIEKRCTEHFNHLKNNLHHSVKFQNDLTFMEEMLLYVKLLKKFIMKMV